LKKRDATLSTDIGAKMVNATDKPKPGRASPGQEKKVREEFEEV
jgi:hypothetical protein